MSIRTALENRLDRIEKNDKGFTLIELLVVVIIIGILAAIAVPVFLGQQGQAQDSAAISDLATAKVAYVSSLVENPEGDADAAALAALGMPATVTVATAGREFCLERTSDNGDVVFSVDSGTDGPAAGECPAG
ncbi:type IV pilin protein [Microcella sp.]|uniref:type IV pilin protein n=1 Tax=Microcella sp. TaxID=1913979 RepID=UPI0025697E88|nr:prepilin-type N-terminal cleavage/methylation domain-containing protein [Microcella sp.]MBX9471892.1 prepilin-type N-terminal cleavage/methylation domain-containing protein [Microcella sp.]